MNMYGQAEKKLTKQYKFLRNLPWQMKRSQISSYSFQLCFFAEICSCGFEYNAESGNRGKYCICSVK